MKRNEFGILCSFYGIWMTVGLLGIIYPAKTNDGAGWFCGIHFLGAVFVPIIIPLIGASGDAGVGSGAGVLVVSASGLY